MNKCIQFCILVSSLIGIQAYAIDTYGHFQVNRYFNTNIPSYTDQTGKPLKYRVDLEVNYPITKSFRLMSGADGVTGETYFTQGAGRFGATLDLKLVEFFVYHRSIHNFDHESVRKPRFLNDNRFGIKYNFGRKP